MLTFFLDEKILYDGELNFINKSIKKKTEKISHTMSHSESSQTPPEKKKRSIAERKQNWEENSVARSLQRMPERKKYFKTLSDIPVQALYTPEDMPTSTYLEDLGFPGEYPYTRGAQPTMYRARFWTMRQFAGLGNADETNKRFKYLIANGTTGLSVAFHLPTIYGYDSSDPMSLGEVGKEGVAIDTLADMENLFAGIDLGNISTSAHYL